MGVGGGETFQKAAAPWGPGTHRVSGKLVQSPGSFWKKITEILSPLITAGSPAGSSDSYNP